MAITFPSGFNMSHNEPVDNRLVLTKAEMVAIKKAKMPEVYMAICKDDGQLYLYNNANDVDEETGRFRLLKTSSPEFSKEMLEDLVSDDEDNQIIVTEEGTLKVVIKENETSSISQEQIFSLFQKEDD